VAEFAALAVRRWEEISTSGDLNAEQIICDEAVNSVTFNMLEGLQV